MKNVQEFSDGHAGYYGRPIVKPPEWTGLIPTYFWLGGCAGASATLATASRLGKNHVAARVLIYAAALGSAGSAICLIADLKKPSRFLHMMRVFKPTSPMNLGVYLFGAFSGAAITAALSEVTGIARPLGRVAEAVAALCGPAMSVYTSVLIGDTVMPAWHYGRKSMPALFAATSAATAGAVGLCFIPPANARPARRLALLGGAAMPWAWSRLHRELGSFQSQAYESGKAGALANVARLLNAGGCLCALFARRNARAARVAGFMILAAGLAERFAVYEAGKNSAIDPRFTIEAQTTQV